MSFASDVRARNRVETGRATFCFYLRLAILTTLVSLAITPAARASDLDRVVFFNIGAQRLDKALLQFGEQAHLQISFAWNPVTGGTRTRAVIGRYSSRAALAALLDGTGLSYSQHGHTIAVVPLKSSSVVGADPVQSMDPDEEGGAPAAANTFGLLSDYPKATKKQQSAQLQEITITGTHIRRATESVLPTQTFTRADIDRSGQGTLAAFVETVPANFAGGMSETTDAAVAGGGQSAQNETAGTGVNLRGLGNDATLVLIDGHRVAPADLFGNFVDISTVPLVAVEKIDVVTDGASAIYGSDAVGGVVNIITRKDFSGVETRVRFGADGRNDTHESEIAQTIGRSWSSGSALASYEFYDKTPLSAADRSFTSSAPLPFTLLPEQVRQSAFGTLRQSVDTAVSLYSDAYYSHRSSDTYSTILGDFQGYDYSAVDSYGAILGARISVADGTDLDISSDYSAGDADVQGFNLPQRTVAVSKQTSRSILATGEAVLSGGVWSLPAGKVLYAIGVQYRRESYDFRDLITSAQFAPLRNLASGFAELRIPLVGRTVSSGTRPALELSLADREDHYSDVGPTNNVNVGVLWKPIEPVRLRATYGTSFVAPVLNYTNPTPSEVVGFNTTQVPGSAPPGGGVINELIVFGGNGSLRPQTASTWTMGVDWHSAYKLGSRLHVSYYDIRLRNRINNLQSAGYNVYLALPMAGVFGPQVVQLNPSPAVVQQLSSSADFENFGANLGDVGAIVDSRELNLSRVKTEGIDFSAADGLDVRDVTVEPGIDATYVFHLDTQFTSSTPAVDIVGTIYNPTKARLRGHLFVSRGMLSLAAFVNFETSYNNNTALPVTRVASWTTFDLSGTYACDICKGVLANLSATVAVINALNRAPPYAMNGSGFAVNYDGANANPLGRFVSLELGTRW